MGKSILFLLSALGLAVAQTPGTIENFHMFNSGETFIELEWDLVGGDLSIDKYTLTYDGFSLDIGCRLDHCPYKVDFLDPCTEYVFNLVPHFMEGIDGDSVSTTGNTLDLIPGIPINPVAIANTNGILVTWETPSENANCIDKYQICTRQSGDTTSTCIEVGDNTVMITDVELCTDYIITIAALTPVGTAGPAATVTATTPIGIPGVPQNLIVTLSTETTIMITFDDPILNPNCVVEYGIMYGPVESDTLKVIPILFGDHENTISPLDPCTNYSIGVYGVNADGKAGPAATDFAATEDTAPMPPPTIEVTPGGPDSIDVSWPGMPNNLCGDSITICYNDHVHPEEICQDIDGGGGIIEGGGSLTITGLLPCTYYEIVIVINSPSGIPSLPVGNFTYTDDVKPDPVENLIVTSVTAHEMTISYDPPSNMSQCIQEIDTNIINLNEASSTSYVEDNPTPRIAETHTGLSACSDYRAEVRTVSRQGLQSDWNFVDTVTDEDTPSVVRNLQERLSTIDSVTLLWFQPETNPRCATTYLVEWTGGGSTVVNVAANDFSVEHTISGLTACTTYTFTVTAQSNSAGNSAPTSVDITTVC